MFSAVKQFSSLLPSSGRQDHQGTRVPLKTPNRVVITLMHILNVLAANCNSCRSPYRYQNCFSGL